MMKEHDDKSSSTLTSSIPPTNNSSCTTAATTATTGGSTDAETATTTAGGASLLPLPPNPSYVFPLSSFPPLHVFDRSTTYPAIIVPVQRTAELRNRLSTVLLHRPKTRNVYENDKDKATRKMVLMPEQPQQQDDTTITTTTTTSCWDNPILQSLLQENNSVFRKSTYTIHSSYADWTVEEVLRKLLPVSEVPSAFEIIGHLAHVNLREDVLPYKYIVGKVLLDKNAPRIRTVVNKVGSIGNTVYRTFGMEVIAGDDSDGYSVVTVKEEGCQFDLDFQRVYWNSRLGGEHRRLVHLIRKDALTRKQQQQQKEDSSIVVADLMAGVGPFAIPLAMGSSSSSSSSTANQSRPKKQQKQKQQQQFHNKIRVYANDLNPDSYKYLVLNRRKNKCQENDNNNNNNNQYLRCYNMDARAFCHQLQDQGVDFHHAIMNLPASAPEFLDAFRGFTGTTLPRIHVYCFAPKKDTTTTTTDDDDGKRTALERCEKALGCPLKDDDDHDSNQSSSIDIRIVRDVSPNKNMLCISFTLPEQARQLTRIDLTPRPNATTTTISDKSAAATTTTPLPENLSKDPTGTTNTAKEEEKEPALKRAKLNS